MPAPSKFKFGSVVFDVWQLGDGRYAFDYQEGSRRRVVKRRDLGKLKAEASRISTDLLNGETEALQLGSEDRRIYVTARERLVPLGIEVDQAARILTEAFALVGSTQRIIEACRYFAAMQPGSLTLAAVAHIVDELLREKELAGLSDSYIRKMRDDLKKFAADFPGAIAEIKAADIASWLVRQPVAGRRRKNLRDEILLLFNFARDHQYLPPMLQTEAEKTQRPKVFLKPVAIFTPNEFSLLLDTARDKKFAGVDFLPFLAIGGFAGLRSAEIERLDWHAVKWSQNVIEVSANRAKTGRRRLVPICDSLAAWLSPYRDSMGPVLNSEVELYHIIEKVSLAAGITWKRNGLRHSFGSYRTAQTGDIGRVSLEMGNSPQMVRQHYLEAVHQSEASSWFSITPNDANNVLTLPLQFRK
jgi:integrase